MEIIDSEKFDAKSASLGGSVATIASLSLVPAVVGAVGSGSGAVAVTTGLVAIGGSMIGGIVVVAAGVLGTAVIGTCIAGKYGISVFQKFRGVGSEG